MKKGDVLVLDRLSSHLSKDVKIMFEKKGVNFLFLPVKASLLLSPLDRGFFGEFSKKYREENNLTPIWIPDRKFQMAVKVHDEIPHDHIKSFFYNCGLTSTQSMEMIKKNFEREMGRTDFTDDLKKKKIHVLKLGIWIL